MHPGDDEIQTAAFVYSILKAELEALCIQASAAAGLLDEELARGPGHPTRIWLHLQSILVISANGSKLLWGKGQKKARQRLRCEAGVFGRRSPLKDKKVRNTFEHIDEKVIRWAETGGSQYVERRIKWSSDEEEPIPGATNFGRFDVLDRTVSILGLEPIKIDELLAEMATIRERLGGPFGLPVKEVGVGGTDRT